MKSDFLIRDQKPQARNVTNNSEIVERLEARGIRNLNLNLRLSCLQQSFQFIVALILIITFDQFNQQTNAQLQQQQPLRRVSSFPSEPSMVIDFLNDPDATVSLLPINQQQVGANQVASNPRSMAMMSEPVDMIIPPYESYGLNKQDQRRGLEQEVSYVIDRKRFIEAFATRCMSSTYSEDPYLFEPNFSLIKPTSETRLNATVPMEQIKLAGFEPNKKTVFLVHGFTQSYPHTVWLRKTRALFETNSFVSKENLFIMDYGKASHQSYAQVAAMASMMGSFLTNFIMKLLALGADPMSIHVIGHSLGAHISGFAGKRIKPKLGRITALDPAGPCFGKVLSNDAMDRLGPEDAHQVAVYHYDDDFLGLPGQHGQFDIYVNGGRSQPGCTDNVNTMFQALVTMVFRRKRVLSESHTRSTEVATARLGQAQCQQVAYECRDYQSFISGECGRCDEQNNQCFLMAFDHQYAELGEIPLRTSHPGKKLYISTSSAEPFCQQHYQVLIKFEPSPELATQARNYKWRIQMEAIIAGLDGNNKKVEFMITNQMAPNVFSYLWLSDSIPPIDRIKSARLLIKQSDGKLVQLQQQSSSMKQFGRHSSNNQLHVQLPFKVFNIEINFLSNVDHKLRKAYSSRLCPIQSAPIGPLISSRPPQTPQESQFLSNSIDSPEGWHYFENCFEF